MARGARAGGADASQARTEFVLFQITESNRLSKADSLDPAIRVLDELRSAWAEVAKQGK
jgi:flagellin-specific chaperone FliS